MKTYHVSAVRFVQQACDAYIEAESEDEAREQFEDCPVDWEDLDVHSITIDCEEVADDEAAE